MGNKVNIEQQVDKTWGGKENILLLIKENKWEEASQYGDHITYQAVINNEDWIWQQSDSIDSIDKNIFNSCSYGNLAIVIHYGSKFSDRAESIMKLKNFCLGL